LPIEDSQVSCEILNERSLTSEQRGQTMTRTHARSTALQLGLVAGIFLLPSMASAEQLCGRPFDTLTQLYTDVSTTRNAGRITLKYATHVVVQESEKIWVFARESYPGWPAALCHQWIQAGGQTDHQIQNRCEGAKAACDAFVTKFSSPDWSGPLQR
jgi:hypothetical protein